MAKKDKIDNWADDTDSEIYIECAEKYEIISKAYKNREEADMSIRECWKIYNAELDDNQIYQGNSTAYVPTVRDSVTARARRALKQLFPAKYNHVDAIGSDGRKPYPQLALLEHYIRETKLKSVIRTMLIAGDVTGQWNLYVDWLSEIRNVTDMIKKNPILQTVEGSELDISDPNEEEESLEDKEIKIEHPDVTDFATEDLVVIPPTVNDIEKADITCIRLYMTKDKIKRMVDDGIFILSDDSELSEWIGSHKGTAKVPEKQRAEDAGIKTEGTFKYALIFEAHIRIKFPKDEHKSLAYIYYAGENEVIGIIKAPQWGQKRPILSAPVERIAGSFHGISKIEPVKTMQWNLNDFWNMGQDSAMYSLLPIVMTDPEKNPNYAMMVFGLAAVWPVSPDSTKFQEFPQLWKDSIGMCQSIKAQIHESLDVNEMMMGVSPKGRKNNAQVGSLQQESSVSVIDHAERVEEEILNPLMERFFEYDAQFRNEPLTVIKMGELGVHAQMEQIPLQQWGERYFFQWTGTDFMMNMQRMQQQIATMNVLRGIPPQQMNGLRLDITPILQVLVDNVYGAELSPRILIDDRNKFTISPEIEDEMIINFIPVDVHEADNDAEHIPVHQKAAQATGDPGGHHRNHIEAHMKQMQKKREMAMPQMQQGQQGMPGGNAPGVPGNPPRPGAQPGMPNQQIQPPGGIHPDQQLGTQGRG